ncbi:MAG TPA: hypothetical protein VKH81_04070 [Candidatus Angelobacter sp.]|nr:hypothetical protein [Candidatus Angelobacter sp.]
MKPAAMGIRVHSGWGALVILSGQPGAEEVVDRRKLTIIDPKASGVTQPYHHVEEMELRAAERHLNKCAADSRRLAVEALGGIAKELRGRDLLLGGAAILLSSARPLPDLDEILSSHALIHTAEGEFFRHAFRQALAHLEIPMVGIRERELQESAKQAFGKSAAEVQKRIEGMGRSLGPPWTQDEKFAALAAAIVLSISTRTLSTYH